MELKNDYFVSLKTKKQIAFRNSDFIKKMATDIDFKLQKNALYNRAERIRSCLNYWEWAKYDISKIMDLKKVSRCKDVYCPNCRRFNIGKYLVRVMPVFENLIMQNYNPYMITLTVPNCDGDDLKSTIERMNISFKYFYRYLSAQSGKFKIDLKCFDIGGAVKCLEITYNSKTNKFHPHFHIIAFVENDEIEDFYKYEPGGYHIKTDEYIYYSEADMFIQSLWTRCFYSINKKDLKLVDDEEILRCDVRAIDMPGGVFEVFKYIFKDSNIQNYYTFKTVFNALANKKLKQGYGLLYSIKDDEIDDEIDDDNDIKNYILEEEEFEILRFNNIMDVVNKYNDYKKISRFNKDNDFYNSVKD